MILTFPKIEIEKYEALQDHFYDGKGGYYSVSKLIDLASDLPEFDCPLVALELSGEIWNGSSIIALASHCKRVFDADLDKPIILDWEGGIADGRHRVIKALIEGRSTIRAKRLMKKPDPCRRDE